MIFRSATAVVPLIWLFCLAALGGPSAAATAEPGALPCSVQAADAKSYRDFAACEARRIGLPPQIAAAVMEIESGFDPGARGAAGEVGLMQVMPATAQMLGFRGADDSLADPATNILLGVKYLAKAHRLAGGDLCTTVMKYRAGHNETRFSALSVAYCMRARKILSRDGYEVTGAVPAVSLLPGVPAPPTGSEKTQPAAPKCVDETTRKGAWIRECVGGSSVRITRVRSTQDTGTGRATVRVIRSGVAEGYAVSRVR